MLIANLRTKRTLLSLAVAAALTLSVQASAADTLQGKVVADEAPNYSTQSGKQYWVLTGTEQTAESNALTINDANGTALDGKFFGYGGDSAQLMLYVAVLAAAVCGLTAAVVIRRRRG